MTKTTMVKLHRNGHGGYYADTSRGRVDVSPVHMENGKIEGWMTSWDDGRQIGGMSRTLADVRRELA